MRLLLAALVFLAGCATPDAFVVGSRKTLDVASQAQTVGLKQFRAYDRMKERGILAAHQIDADTVAEIKKWRAISDKAMDGFDAFGEVTETASVAVDAVEAGKAGAAAAAIAAIAALMSAAVALADVLKLADFHLPLLDQLLGRAPPATVSLRNPLHEPCWERFGVAWAPIACGGAR